MDRNWDDDSICYLAMVDGLTIAGFTVSLIQVIPN